MGAHFTAIKPADIGAYEYPNENAFLITECCSNLRAHITTIHYSNSSTFLNAYRSPLHDTYERANGNTKWCSIPNTIQYSL